MYLFMHAYVCMRMYICMYAYVYMCACMYAEGRSKQCKKIVCMIAFMTSNLRHPHSALPYPSTGCEVDAASVTSNHNRARSHKNRRVIVLATTEGKQ